MADSTSSPHVSTALLEGDPAVPPPACPMCGTGAPLTQQTIDAGGAWQCARCGQHWDAARLVAVASYSAWAVERERAGQALRT